MDTVKQTLQKAVLHLFDSNTPIILSRPDPKFGDYSTNIAMQLTKQLGKSPTEIAQTIADYLNKQSPDWLKSAQVVNPGFINIVLTDTALANIWSLQVPQLYANKTIIAEYSDPNPFKSLHAGHLYTTLVGNAVANLYSYAGAKVYRLNYGGDVGLHVAKAMFGIIKYLGGEDPKKLHDIEPDDRLGWISQRYVEGNQAYESDSESKQMIIDINKKVYDIHANNDTKSDFAQIYWTCRSWSYEGFEKLYQDLIVQPFDEYIAESKVTPIGLELVKQGLNNGVFVKSDDAVIFTGEDYGLHTRVFINSNGLPTYEAKELGLASYKWQKYHFDTSIIITGNDIVEYMKVLLKATSHFYPEVSKRTVHVTHGMIKLVAGQKMSSRKGNVLMANDIITAARQANMALSGKDDLRVAIGAVKYSFLKQRMGGDILYDPEESISLQGNSGPYLQYAHARARSILQKSTAQNSTNFSDLTDHERLLVGVLADYQDVLTQAITDLTPHHICSYLYELAQVFNRFYENSKVIGDERESLRRTLVERYAQTLKAGLGILGIDAPDAM